MRTRLSPVIFVGLACVKLCLGKAIDEIIMEAANSSTMFDLMQMSPEGEVMVMVDLDIMMTVKEYVQYKGGHLGNPRRNERKALADVTDHWTDCYVYFEFSPDFWEDRTSIDAAMAEWQEHTCLRFTPAQPGTPDRIRFKKGDGCYSRLGKTGGTQEIGLAKGCLQKGVVVHEIGHAIGWIHEQARPDRDQYIRVHFNRIPENWHSQFERFPDNLINYYNIPYDYRSIMHYSGNAVAPGSIETQNPMYQQIIGQREGLSYKDIKLANLMYNCSGMNKGGRCKSGCSHHGEAYQDKNCKCMCPGKNDTLPVVPCGPGSTTVRPVTTARPGRPTTTRTVATTTNSPPMECRDVREDCAGRARAGECSMNPGNMAMYCKKSCDFCNKDVCMDYQDACPMLRAGGFCSTESTFYSIMQKQCRKSCEFCTPEDPCKTQRALGLFGDVASNGHPGTGYSHHLLALISLLIAAALH